MGKQAFTPGPWEVWRGDVWSANDFLIANVNRAHEVGGGKANARLIAVAPKLYEALDDMYRWATHQEGFDATEWADVRAALAKAVTP